MFSLQSPKCFGEYFITSMIFLLVNSPRQVLMPQRVFADNAALCTNPWERTSSCVRGLVPDTFIPHIHWSPHFTPWPVPQLSDQCRPTDVSSGLLTGIWGSFYYIIINKKLLYKVILRSLAGSFYSDFIILLQMPFITLQVLCKNAFYSIASLHLYTLLWLESALPTPKSAVIKHLVPSRKWWTLGR